MKKTIAYIFLLTSLAIYTSSEVGLGHTFIDSLKHKKQQEQSGCGRVRVSYHIPREKDSTPGNSKKESKHNRNEVIHNPKPTEKQLAAALKAQQLLAQEEKKQSSPKKKK